METIFANTVDKGINIIGFTRSAAEEAVARGRDLHGRVHASETPQNLRGDASPRVHRTAA